jgi:hypothetical protein
MEIIMAFQPFFDNCSATSTVTQTCTTPSQTVKVSRLPITELVQNDTGPQLLMTLKDTNTDTFLDLSQLGTLVQFNFSTGPSSDVKAVIPMTPGPNAALGQAMLDWSAGTTGAMDTVGTYYGEVQITWPNGRIQTTPAKLKFHVQGELG